METKALAAASAKHPACSSSPPTQTNLPVGWVAHVSKDGSPYIINYILYYHNRATNETSWTMPQVQVLQGRN